MTDREPLRVGPLVLEWTTGRVTREYPRPLPDAYVHHLAGSWQLVIRQREDGFWVWGTERDGDSWRGSQHAYQEVVVAGALIYLTETGYLAQYRSRRRLLARELESLSQRYYRHADTQKGWAIQTPSTELAERRHFERMAAASEARAAKYARWAVALRNA